ncbi:unnamed protein product [Rhizophagus irregularis]|nr:unnamed protein product [Rhizophagus irregularis]
MTTSTNNKNDDTENEWIQWIKDGIAKEFINYHDFSEFQNIKQIGSGGFGNVYRANWSSSNTVVALKSLTNGIDIMKNIVNEIKLMHSVNFHANIIQFFGITSNTSITSGLGSNYLFILEYADSGTLKDYLKNNFTKLNWNIKLQFAVQIADAVSCIHQKDIIHYDLHSDNILVHKNAIKLADFGLSRKAGVSNSAKDVMGKVPYIDPQRLKRLGPHVLNIKQITMIRNQMSLICHILEGNREVPIVGTPDNYISIYTRCWRDNPDDRPDMHQVFSDLVSLSMNENTLLAEGSTDTGGNIIEQKINNSLSSDQSSYNSQIIKNVNYVPSQEVTNGNDLKIIMTGIEGLKDLDVNNTVHYKQINIKPSLEDENYEVFGSVILKNNLRLEDILISFELHVYDFNGFSVIIKPLNNADIDITKCYLLWMIIGSSPKLSAFSPRNRELQVYCIKESIALKPTNSYYSIKTSCQLFQGYTISVNVYCPTANHKLINLKINIVGWSEYCIYFRIAKSNYNNLNSDSSSDSTESHDGDTDFLTNVEITICILSSNYENLSIDNMEGKEYSLASIGHCLTENTKIIPSINVNELGSEHLQEMEAGIKKNDVVLYPLKLTDYERDDKEKPHRFDVRLKLRMSLDIARGLKFLRTVEILHHDIRAENILITLHETAKLANFKSCHSLFTTTLNQSQNLERVRYCAPELLEMAHNFNLALKAVDHDPKFRSEISKMFEVLNNCFEESKTQVISTTIQSDVFKEIVPISKFHPLINEIRTSFRDIINNRIHIEEEIKSLKSDQEDLSYWTKIVGEEVGFDIEEFSDEFSSMWERAYVQNQVTILKELHDWQNIIRVYGLACKRDNWYLVSEWAEYGNLREYYTNYGDRFDMRLKLRMSLDIARGLNFLRAVEILHYDIRAENILITLYETAKLANFKLNRPVFATLRQRRNLELVRYCAPELLEMAHNFNRMPPSFIELANKAFNHEPELRPKIVDAFKTLSCCFEDYNGFPSKSSNSKNSQLQNITLSGLESIPRLESIINQEEYAIKILPDYESFKYMTLAEAAKQHMMVDSYNKDRDRIVAELYKEVADDEANEFPEAKLRYGYCLYDVISELNCIDPENNDNISTTTIPEESEESKKMANVYYCQKTSGKVPIHFNCD